MKSKGVADLEVAEGEEEEDEEDEGVSEDSDIEDALPDKVSRRCTDLPWLVLFILGNAMLGHAIQHSWHRGNLEKDLSFSDGYNGDPCGFGTHYVDKYLIFCQKPVNESALQGEEIVPELDMTNAVCISHCPTGSNTSWACNGTRDYPSIPFMGMMCKPKDKNMTQDLQNWFKEHLEARMVLRFRTIRNIWMLLLGCALLAIIVFLLYILFLAKCGGCLVWTIFSLLIMVPLLCGAYFLHCWQDGGCNDNTFGAVDADPTIDLATGIALVGVGLIFLCTAYNRGDAIDLAVNCLEAACDCIVETGGLRLVPVIALVLRLAVIVELGVAFMLLLSTGKQVGDDQATVLFHGMLTIHTVFSSKHWAYLALTLVMFFWDFHFISALTDFTSMYLTELWFFTSRHGEGTMPSCALSKAYWAALRYHCGTLSLGALLLGLTALPRWILGVVSSQARTAHNPVTLLLGAVCFICVGVFERCLAPLTKDAYMELCLTGRRTFCEAARRALVLVRSEEEAVKILNGVTWFFQIGALLSVAALGNFLTLIAVQSSDTFSNPKSPSYVYNKQLVAIAGAIASSVAALPFMMIFDTVSDTIIFCYAVQKHRFRMKAASAAAGRYCGCSWSNAFPCARARTPTYSQASASPTHALEMDTGDQFQASPKGSPLGRPPG